MNFRGRSQWQRPAQQGRDVEILCSIEQMRLPAVFGTSSPPRGISGMIRRLAFRRSNRLMALAYADDADRINVVEGIVSDLAHPRIPNIPADMGIRSGIEHNKPGLAKKAGVLALLAPAPAAGAARSHPSHQRRWSSRWAPRESGGVGTRQGKSERSHIDGAPDPNNRQPPPKQGLRGEQGTPQLTRSNPVYRVATPIGYAEDRRTVPDRVRGCNWRRRRGDSGETWPPGE
jgi:hypothetical protein